MMNRTPVAGHISSLRAAKNEQEIKTTIKDASKKHRDPRTGLVQEGPSVQGPITIQNSDQYYSDVNVDSKNQNGHGHNNGENGEDVANAISGKLDINIRDDKKAQEVIQVKDNLEQKSSTPPPKPDTKAAKPKKTSGIRRVFSLGKNSNNTESLDKTANDVLNPSLNSTAPKVSQTEPPSTHENGTNEPDQNQNEILQAPISHYLVEDSAYGSMDVIKKW